MASRRSGRHRARSNASTPPWPAAPCSATAPTRGRACGCTSGARRCPDLFIHDYTTGADAVSRIDEANLDKVAGELGVGYVHRTAPVTSSRSRTTPPGRRHRLRRRARHQAAPVLGAGVRRDRARALAVRPHDPGDRRRSAGARRQAAEGIDMTATGDGQSGISHRRKRRLLVLPVVIVLLAVSIKLLTMSWYSTARRLGLRRRRLRARAPPRSTA